LKKTEIKLPVFVYLLNNDQFRGRKLSLILTTAKAVRHKSSGTNLRGNAVTDKRKEVENLTMESILRKRWSNQPFRADDHGNHTQNSSNILMAKPVLRNICTARRC